MHFYRADERVEIYPTLINKSGIKVVILNGEADSCVPITGVNL